jgi:molybdate transport system ATP-binding protein
MKPETNELAARQSAPALASAEFKRTFAAGFALQVAFELEAGITILFGPSGSGKTTLLNCMAGLLAPDSGRLVVAGRVLYDSATGVDVAVQQRRVGYLFQHVALFPHLTVGQNVEYGLAELERGERRRRAGDILDRFGIGQLAGRRPAEISGGERQRTALARALVREPKYLLLDEPLSALDRATKSTLIADLRRWNAAKQIPILYVTHDRAEVFALGERLLALDNGRITAAGAPLAVLEDPRHEFAASLSGFENLFRARVEAEHPELGTMTCSLQGTDATIECPLHAGEVGMEVKVGIRAGDILLSIPRPEGLSARNVLGGTIRSLRRLDVAVEVLVEAAAAGNAVPAVLFRVHITPGTVAALGLREGQPVHLVMKTHSCRVMRD